MGKEVKVRTAEDLKNLILTADEVKEVIAKTVNERTEKYKQHFQLLPNEDNIYKEVHKDATAIIERIMCTYNHGMLKYFAEIMKKGFTSIYEKIVVNE
jgi:hypothetical protein